MPRIRTDDFLDRVAKTAFRTIRLKGLQRGSFYLTLETEEDVFILENADGSMKEYPRADHALVWLRRMTDLKDLIVDIEIWNSDRKK